jgi:hypothetical protein
MRFPDLRFRRPIVLLMGAVWTALAWGPEGVAGPELERPLPVDQSRSTTARHLAKPVFESRVLDDMETAANWVRFGPGEMQITAARARRGEHSVRLTAPTQTGKPPPVQGRPFAETGVRRVFGGEDWSGFNRLAFWVYPDLPGFRVVSLLVRLQSEGTQGRRYTDGGLHYVLLRNGEWNPVVWEIAHLERRQVQAVELVYRLQGNEPEATNRVSFDFDQLELQRVEPDPFLGWSVASGRVAFNSLGYAPDAAKTALVAGSATRFEVLDEAGAVVFESPVENVRTALGEFGRVDFSALRRPGDYRLRGGELTTPLFAVTADPWRETQWAVLNSFFGQRCGFAVPGIHGVCHRDWQVQRGEQRIVINGGWHDAGDLSQGLVNTAEAAWAMLRLAEVETERDPALSDRLLAEARWGTEWLLKTRWGDGSRVTWATMDFWTDGILGTPDDVVVDAHSAPFDNFLAAATEALAARLWRSHDPVWADYSQRCAEQDWAFALEQLREPEVEVASAGVQAGIELFRATGRTEFADRAVALADVLLASQERRVRREWTLPLTGFFYRSPQQETPLHYSHRSHEQAPVVALADLCGLLPAHPKWIEWYAAVAWYAEYLRLAAEVTAPYHMLPAGIWRTDRGADWERAQARRGVRLDEQHYLRRFPCWPDFRGNLGVQLSQAKALSTAARLRRDAGLRELAEAQLHWSLGRNPFAQSLMYGVGHDYAPQYTAMSGDMVGTLPVGIQSRGDDDAPYWPMANCYNYAEVWVHPGSRWLAILADLAGDGAAPAGDLRLHARAADGDAVEIGLVSSGERDLGIELRTFNLSLPEGGKSMTLPPGKEVSRRVLARVTDPAMPWLIVAFPVGQPEQAREVMGGLPGR